MNTCYYPPPRAMSLLLEYHWPGNVRQLENVMEHAAALSPGQVISDTLIDKALPGTHATMMSTLSDAKKEFEREYVAQLLKSTRGDVPLAARLAGRNRSDFYKIVNRHRLDVNSFRASEKA